MSAASVLIADDDALLRETLGDCLSGLGYEVRTAADGSAAVAELGRARCDLLVSDVDMPGLSGFQVLEWVRARWSELPVILMSARANGELERSARGAGACLLMAKPLDIGRFVPLVRSIVR